jgi:hypothetical protein
MTLPLALAILVLGAPRRSPGLPREGSIAARRRIGSVRLIADGTAAQAYIGEQVRLYRDLGRRLGIVT